MAQVTDAITIRSQTTLSQITTTIGVSHPFDGDDIGQPPKPYSTAALWDTGASHCSITKSLAQNLGLHPIDKVLVQHAKGQSYENVYFAIVQVTDKYYLEVEITECQSSSTNFEVIIGMDVISKGDFSITNVGGQTTFSFRLPSLRSIDYKAEL